MYFKLSYDEAKKLLQVFYQSPYQISAPYVHILDNLLNEDALTLKKCIEAEMAANQVIAVPETAQ